MIEDIWRQKEKSWRHALLFMTVICLLVGLLNLSAGSVAIPLSEVFKSLLGLGSDDTWTTIVRDFRLPRTLTAVLVGSSLGLSGLLMQTLFRNPLAGPFVLGISSGASLGVALLIMGAGWFPFLVSGTGTVAGASLGAMGVLAMVIAMSRYLKDTASLLIIGLMFGSAVGAVVSVLQYFSNPEAIQNYLFWTFGSLSGVTWEELTLFVPVTLLGLLAVLAISKHLNIMLLGDSYAQSLGINLYRFRLLILVITGLLAGTTTAFCGPIAFVGIAVPHIARLILQTSDQFRLAIAVTLLGAIVMLICDLISQLPGLVQTLPINAITSIFGAPLIIWLIIRTRKPLSF